MTRQALTDGTARWFDLDKAIEFDEETRWNGQNHVSLATGDQFEHEKLYRTAGGQWVLHNWSQWQGSADSWRLISNEDAARWLSQNKHEPHTACEREFEALEIA